jgi:MoaA/NifB/PqqE/SkfB family radical SAM enzyme
MDDARADCDKFMTEDMFRKVIDFNLKYDPTITITGGEPTENPNFWKFMDIVADKISKRPSIFVTVCTNGMNFTNEDIPKMRDLRNKAGSKNYIYYQVTHVPKYYPIPIDLSLDVFKEPTVTIAEQIEYLQYAGRAKNHPEWKFFQPSGPKCFNIRSMIRNGMIFQDTISQLRSMGKFCTPQISYDGHIKVGEATLCPDVAHITDSDSLILRKIRSFTGSGCSHITDHMPTMYRDAIGE